MWFEGCKKDAAQPERAVFMVGCLVMVVTRCAFYFSLTNQPTMAARSHDFVTSEFVCVGNRGAGEPPFHTRSDFAQSFCRVLQTCLPVACTKRTFPFMLMAIVLRAAEPAMRLLQPHRPRWAKDICANVSSTPRSFPDTVAGFDTGFRQSYVYLSHVRNQIYIATQRFEKNVFKVGLVEQHSQASLI